MERPAGSWQPPRRQVTGEIVYIQHCLDNSIWPIPYADVPEETQREYEEAARAMREAGTPPPVMAAYERYDDSTPSPLAVSCRALAEVLLQLRATQGMPDSSHARIALAMPSEEILKRLKAIRTGELLTGDEERLTLPSDLLDARKSTMPLAEVTFDVGRSERNCAIGIEGERRRTIPFPAGESVYDYKFEVTFAYKARDGRNIYEVVVLTIDEFGELHVFRTIDMEAYAHADRENYKSIEFTDISEADSTQLADLFAEMVGDTPETVRQHTERTFLEAISEADEALQRQVAAFITRTDLPYTMRFMSQLWPKGMTLPEALMNSEIVGKICGQLAAKIEMLEAQL